MSEIANRLREGKLSFAGLAANLIEAQEEFIRLSAESEAILLPIAAIHGCELPPELIARGKELREKIAKLEKSD